MKLHELIRELREDNGSKIVLLVADGLGGLPMEPGGKTELETARTPNLDQLARDGVCGLSTPVLPGITPGSGAGASRAFRLRSARISDRSRHSRSARHQTLEVGPRDVATRGNFCTLDASGKISDRRAGRPTTERCVAMCRLMQAIRIPVSG